MDSKMKMRILKIGIIASGIIALGISMSDFIIKQYLSHSLGVDFSGHEATSMAIIGGADGPTSIFLSEEPVFPSKYIWTLVFLAIAGICFWLYRKLKMENR